VLSQVLQVVRQRRPQRLLLLGRHTVLFGNLLDLRYAAHIDSVAKHVNHMRTSAVRTGAIHTGYQ
jgi:hypothetical protein